MKLWITIIALLNLSNSYADAWEDLTYDQAVEVQKFLKRNKFILDYCDCCSDADVYLMKVLKSEIITCPYNSAKYSVKTQSVRIGKFAQNTGRVDVTESVPFEYEEDRLVDYTISMNYTFGLRKKTNSCAPIGKIISFEYENRTTCNGIGLFANPFKLGIEINDDEYKKWARKKLRFK